MTFLEHLEELRKRLWIGLVLVVAGVAVAYVFRSRLMVFLLVPLEWAWRQVLVEGANIPAEPMIHYRSMTEPFFTDLKVAFLGGLWVGVPLFAWQVWMFVAPGLMPKEKRYAIPFLLFSYVFFTGGMYFCWRVVLPVAFRFFFNYAAGMKAGVTVNPTLMLNDFVGLSVKMMAAFGLVFQLPLVACLLTIAHVVDWRMLVRYTRWAIVAAFVVGGVLTPTPDPASQLMMAVPLLCLYLLSIALSLLIWPGGHANRLPFKGGGKK